MRITAIPQRARGDRRARCQPTPIATVESAPTDTAWPCTSLWHGMASVLRCWVLRCWVLRCCGVAQQASRHCPDIVRGRYEAAAARSRKLSRNGRSRSYRAQGRRLPDSHDTARSPAKRCCPTPRGTAPPSESVLRPGPLSEFLHPAEDALWTVKLPPLATWSVAD